MKERYQQVDEKTELLKELMSRHPHLIDPFDQQVEMSWIFQDAALEGIVYTHAELNAALADEGAPDASMVPVVLDIQNQKLAIDYVRSEARAVGKKQAQVTLTHIKRLHDLIIGNTPEAQSARGRYERREKTEKELAKEKDRTGFRKDMPLHRTYFHEIAQPPKIQPLLEKLVDHTASAEFRELHVIKQAAVVQHQLMHIFPFTESSGRVARLCSNMLLLRHGYYPCIIHSMDRQRYYDALRGSPSALRSMLVESMENALENGIKYFRDLSRKYRANTQFR